jgi:penicillin-binding protein 2
VVNAGFGAAVAAPIARKALDYDLLGKRPGDTDKPAPKPADPVPADEDPEAPTAGADFKPGGETPGNKD